MTLRAFRKAMGLTQAEMGKKLGITKVTYGQWEIGRRFPSASTLVRICKAFPCTVLVTSRGVDFRIKVKKERGKAPVAVPLDEPTLGSEE